MNLKLFGLKQNLVFYRNLNLIESLSLKNTIGVQKSLNLFQYFNVKII